MSIKAKILLGYILIVIMVSIGGFVGLRALHKINRAFDNVAEETLPVVKELEALRFYGQRIVAAANEFGFLRKASQSSPGALAMEDVEEQEYSEAAEQMARSLQRYERLVMRFFPEEKALLQQVSAGTYAMHDAGADFIAVVKKNLSTEELLAKKERFEKIEQKFIHAVDTALEHENDEFLKKKEGVNNSLAAAVRIDLAMSLIALIAAILFGTYITRSIVHPINVLKDAAMRIGEGEFNEKINISSHGEIGVLAGAFRFMQAQIAGEMHERYKAENRLNKFVDKLAKSNQELQNFVHVASHDLQEPLRKVLAFGNQLKTKYGKKIGDKGQDYLERMENAAEQMQALINDLLTFTRITTMAQPFVSVDLARVAQEVISDLEVSIEQTGGRVEMADLPTIDADPVQMHQLFKNLIDNALKFHRKDDAPIVKIHSEFIMDNEGRSNTNSGNGECCQITIADNGMGFDEKYVDRVFGVFQRLHGRSEYKGTGIGLAVCRKVIELHGGTITAKSIPGQGTTFIIILPLQQPEGELWISTEKKL